jgi:hypothetical protein
LRTGAAEGGRLPCGDVLDFETPFYSSRHITLKIPRHLSLKVTVMTCHFEN